MRDSGGNFVVRPGSAAVSIGVMSDDSRQLLLRFSHDRSETAFRTLVARHAPLVHAVALRKLNGDAAAAQDVTQEVFTLLARKAPRLQDVVLSGWLYRQTCRRAANHIRTEQRRKHREKIAMETFPSDPEEPDPGGLARELDAAMLSLPAADRDALVLRFFERMEFAAVGQALGITGEAARKRVGRALEKLAQTLGRKGITTAAAALGSTMNGFGATALPAATVARISANSLAAAPAVSGGLIGLLKPLAAGVLAGSLVTVPLLAVQRGSVPPSADSALAAVPPAQRPPARVRSSVGEASLESLIRQLKQIEAGPSTILSSLRRDALLEKISFSEIPAFMALAKEMLTPAEKLGIYEPLLERWAAEDPDAALTLVLDEKIVAELRPVSSTNVLLNLFDNWSRKDLHGAKEWLLEQWANEGLDEAAFMGTIRFHFARSVAESLFLDHGTTVLSDFIQRIPDDVGRSEALGGVAGHHPYHGQVQIRDIPGKRLEALEYIASLPVQLRSGVMIQYARNWAESHPVELLSAMQKAGRRTAFDLALGRLAARREPGVRTPTAGGYMESPIQVTDIEARADFAIHVGMEAGLSRAEILKAVASVIVERFDRDRFFEWFERHQHEADFDEIIVGRVRWEARGYNTSADFPGRVALEWAARISDPALRLRLSRGIFRQLLANNWATSVPEDLALDPQVRAELQRILEEAR
jgi:RNA polymerase sigma factor (sigma-70 family)